MLTKTGFPKTLIDEFATVAPSPIHGHGLFAQTDIPAGTFLGRYEGREVTWQTAGEDITYVLWKGLSGTGIDGTNNWRFANSSETPNVEIRDGQAFYALQDIKKGDEMTWRYLKELSPETLHAPGRIKKWVNRLRGREEVVRAERIELPTLSV